MSVLEIELDARVKLLEAVIDNAKVLLDSGRAGLANDVLTTKRVYIEREGAQTS